MAKVKKIASSCWSSDKIVLALTIAMLSLAIYDIIFNVTFSSNPILTVLSEIIFVTLGAGFFTAFTFPKSKISKWLRDPFYN